MYINRNNYEEYFLLYTDNELSVAEKNMVEAFVAANPDLGEELVMLQQSILKPDAVEFFGKEKLIKPQTIDAVTEEKLLLLLDNELPENENKEILLLAANNTFIKKEWELLQQTKLPSADKIIFEDKPSLYRKETRVIPIAWWRMAAAAMLIGFGLWGAVSYFNRDVQKEVSPETVSASPKKELPANTTANTVKTVSTDDEKNEATTTAVQNTTNKNLPVKPGVIVNTSKQQTQTPQKKNDNIVVNEKENKNDIIPDDLNNINSDGSNKRIIANVSPETNTNKINSAVEIPSSLKNNLGLNTSFSNNTVKQNFETFDEEENKSRKTKLGGFFKQVKRVLERKTKIKTGSDDEVRIANMSFAMQ